MWFKDIHGLVPIIVDVANNHLVIHILVSNIPAHLFVDEELIMVSRSKVKGNI